jgi:hypothetical protein
MRRREMHAMCCHQVDNVSQNFIVDGPPTASWKTTIGTMALPEVSLSLLTDPSYIAGMFFPSFSPGGDLYRMYKLSLNVE